MAAPTPLSDVAPQVFRFPRDSRAQAIACCRDMDRAFAPRTLPERPTLLATRAELEEMREKQASGKPLHEGERDVLAQATAYDVSRATIKYDNVSRLRGAMWARVALRIAYREDPSDREAEELGALLQAYLREPYAPPFEVTTKQLEHGSVSVECWHLWARERHCPDKLSERNALAQLQVELMVARDSGYFPARAREREPHGAMRYA